MTRGRNEQSGAEAKRKRSGCEEAKFIRGKRRKADRRGEEPKKKMPATSQPFLSIPSLYRFEGLPDNGKTSSLLSCQRDGRRPHLENCTGKESKQTLRRVAVKPSKKS